MLSQLEPKSVWEIFQQICAIPHPSYHEEEIAAFIIEFANKHNLKCETDDVGNILISKPAAQGCENKPSIALQAHMDMVPQKNEGIDHDFTKDPIKPYIDGEWVTATETTLGADNGVGLASALAILIEPDLKHGPLEVLVTRTEETGMVGAFGLKPNWIKSQYLLNTDSEDEGQIFTGCAGGVEFTASFPITYSVIPETHDQCYQIAFKGLRGGHSGCDIHKGRENAIKLLFRFLAQYLSDCSYRIGKISGGTLRNAIPRESFVELCIPSSEVESFNQAIETFKNDLHQESHAVEDKFNIVIKSIAKESLKRVIHIDQQTKLVNWVNSAPNGVMKMSNELEGIVETSLNLGILSFEENFLKAQFLIRSQIDSKKDEIVAQLISLSDLAGLSYEITGGYSGWNPDLSSNLLAIAKEKYHELFNKDAEVTVIHAGLECGLFKHFYPNLDMISIGPTIVSPHSPNEKVNIKTVSQYWIWLKAILEGLR